MSFGNIVNFAGLTMSDEPLRAEIVRAVADKDDNEAASLVAAIATKRGYACTPEEVKEGYALAVKMSKGEAELSDQQLDFVVGGKGLGPGGTTPGHGSTPTQTAGAVTGMYQVPGKHVSPKPR
jgi:hypothetical protein